MDKRPKVGVGVIVVKDGKVLLGKRKNAHGAGTWCFPGGHLEYKESLENCATRETLEETGIKITNVRKGPYTNDVFAEGQHYITIFMLAEWQSGEPQLMEPDKSQDWQWFRWDHLPKPLFLTIENLLKENYSPFSTGL